MTTQLHDEGEEFIAKQLFESDVYSLPTSVRVGLFHDGEVSGDTTNGDDLVDSDSTGAITTEPSGYSTWSVSLDSTGFSAQTDGSTNWYASNDSSHDFDLSGDTSSSEIDAWYIECDYDQNNDGSNETVLLVTGNLSQSYTLSDVDTLTLEADSIGFTTD